jgi:imidazolonepropionase-like amidohydrolase
MDEALFERLNMFRCDSADTVIDHQAAGCLCHSPYFARINSILDTKFSRRALMAGAGALSIAAMLPKAARAAIPAAPQKPVLITNIRLFDGKSAQLQDGKRILVTGNKITAIQSAGDAPPADVLVIDGRGRTLMPGLIDAHWHTMMAALPLAIMMTADVGYINLVAAEEANRTLMRGFTTVRDMAGPSFGLKRAIDSGLVPGPRIYPSGAMISQTSGHGDYRMPYDIPAAMNAPLNRGEVLNGGVIADGVDQVLKRTREQLMLGATQLKLAAGGGVSSHFDPLDVSQFTEAELRAAVDAAENWGTYVAVHAYTPRAIQTSLRAGVRCIDHGQLMDEDTAKMIADKGAWLSLQPFLDDEDANPHPEGSANRAKQIEMSAGTDTAYRLAKTYKLKTAWGTDTLFDAALAKKQGKQLAKMTRWYSPGEVLMMATSTNAQLLAMCGPRNPYNGKLGVVEAGGFADMLVIDGDPLTNLALVADPEKNLKLIMKDGRIYKNTLTA